MKNDEEEVKITEILKRRGIIKFHRMVIETNPYAVLKLMANLIVVRCEFLYLSGCFEYQCCSDKFDILEDGEVTPEYEVNFTEIRDEESKEITDYQLEFKRKPPRVYFS